MDNCKTGFSVEKFVDHLLDEGSKIPCDETVESFRRTELPCYYDERLYKRGQAFVQENMAALNISTYLGLISVIALPRILKVLVMTNKTSSDMTAYRRYLATIFHVKSWYDYDFQPGSRALASIADVKRKHNSASKKSGKKLKCRITQADMSLTQFGFNGYILIRGPMIGIHNPNMEDLRGFIHLWRVLGYILGLEDRFNICRESVQETKEICTILFNKVFIPELENLDETTIKMLNYLSSGMAAVDPSVCFPFSMTYLQMLVENQDDFRKLKNPNYRKITWLVKFKLYFYSFIIYCLRFRLFRLYQKYTIKFKLWLVTVFPILPYIRFGLKNGRVDFLKIIGYSEKQS